jgi:hypothetical protein
VQPVERPAGWERAHDLSIDAMERERGVPAAAVAQAPVQSRISDFSTMQAGPTPVTPAAMPVTAMAPPAGPSLPPRWAAPPPPQPPFPHRPARADAAAVPAVTSVYLSQLARLAVELAAQASGRCDRFAIRQLWQRLVQWVEDLRSVGGDTDLGDAVAALVVRLSAALAAPTGLATEAAEIADALAALAPGEPGPSGQPGSRPAFWR